MLFRSPTTTRSGSFLVLQLVSTPIRVVTKEVRYIHVLSLTLELSMPMSSPAAGSDTISCQCPCSKKSNLIYTFSRYFCPNVNWARYSEFQPGFSRLGQILRIFV